MKRVFIIHGWDGNPYDAWKAWLKEELVKKGYEIIAPQMPGGENPKLKEWLKAISEVVGKPDKNCYFIGHSLGCIAIMKYVETLKQSEKIGGCIFVAGFATTIKVAQIDNFSEKPLNFDKVMSHTNNFVVIHSDNDKYVPLKKAKEVVEGLNAKLVLEKGKGHIDESDGIHELPSALNSILEMSK